MSRRQLFAGRRTGGATATTAGFSKGCYVTPDLLLVEQETAARVEKAKRTELRWEFFRSKREAKVWIRLKHEEKAGLISNLRRGNKDNRYDLTCPTHHTAGDLFPPPPTVITTYTPDYFYDDSNGNHIVADAKGFPNDTYPLKKKWLLAQYGIAIVEL